MAGTSTRKSDRRNLKENGNNNPSQKRKQRKRGHPDSDAKIIRLTPKEIMENSVFACKVCNEVFKREQNLILHVSMHQIKLKLKRNIDKGLSPIRSKNAYLCPETTCRHHDKRYALTEISSIKKHYGRKHCPKKFACKKCTKKYALKGDLRAHEKRHFENMVAESSKRVVLSNDWSESEEDDPLVDAVAKDSDNENSDDALVDAVAKDSDNENSDDALVDAVAKDSDNENSDDAGFTLSLGTGKQPNDYLPLFDVDPSKREQEQRQTIIDMNAPFDLDMLGSFPMGPTELLEDCNSIKDPKTPITKENSAPVDTLFASVTPAQMMPSTNVYDGLVRPRKSTLPVIDLNLPASYETPESFETNNNGVGSLKSLFATTVEEKHHTTHAQVSKQWESSWVDMAEPNPSEMTVPSSIDGLLMLHFVAKYIFPPNITSQQGTSANNPSFSSFTPVFGGTMPVNINNHYLAGGSSDRSNGLCVSSANQYQGRELKTNDNGSFIPGISSASTLQQQVTSDTPSFSNKSMQGDNASAAEVVGSKINQPWYNM